MSKGRPTLGGEEAGNWGISLFRHRNRENIFDMSRKQDFELSVDSRASMLHSPVTVLERIPPSQTEVIEAMRHRGFWPVYEGKHIDQFLAGTKPVRWWLSVAQAEAKYEKKPRAEPTLVFRETARNMDERTCIACVLPACSAGSHTLTGVKLNHVDEDHAAAVLNSLCFDYALRMRTAGTHVSFTYIQPMPVPPAAGVRKLPTIPTQLASERGIKHVTDDRDFWPRLWEINRAVAEAYGLGPDEFEHILHSFPVFARKRKAFFAYLKERLQEWKAPEPKAAVAASPKLP
jgi:hypothetical protein